MVPDILSRPGLRGLAWAPCCYYIISDGVLQQDPIRWAPVTNIYISGQPMFRTEFIDK